MTEHTTLIASGPAGHIAAVDYGGPGPDVVLIHGGNRTLLDWTPVRARLNGMRLVAYDLRGHGESDVPADSDYSFAAQHADLEAVIDAVGLQRPYVVGHSIGGNVATYYGANSSECSGVISVDGFGGGVADDVDLEARRKAMYDEVFAFLPTERVEADEVAAVVTQYRELMESIGADPDLAEPTTLRALAPEGDGGYLRRPPSAHQSALVDALDALDFFDLLRRLRCRALILKSDREVSVAHLSEASQSLVRDLAAGANRELDATAAELADVTVRRVDAGHLLPLEAPDLVAEAIAAFISADENGGQS